MTNDLYKVLQDNYDRLRKSEKKVADFVMQTRSSVVQMRIVDLAAAAEVSEPTVLRFCRALGFDGFQDFRDILAKDPSRL
ncbi:MAG: MurR/RpiR family transcriptional regulator, partial [Pseudomonadales bacterium]